MSKKDQKPVSHDGELSDQQLDKVAGGQEVRKMETIVVTAKREQPQQVVKMETIVVTAKREKDPATQVAAADTSGKKN
jgi:outer membrane cobalamin receptor